MPIRGGGNGQRFSAMIGQVERVGMRDFKELRVGFSAGGQMGRGVGLERQEW